MPQLIIAHSLLLLQIFSIGLWVNILLEVVANIHQHLPINDNSTRNVSTLASLLYSQASAGCYLSAELMHKRLQKVIVFSVDTKKDQAG